VTASIPAGVSSARQTTRRAGPPSASGEPPERTLTPAQARVQQLEAANAGARIYTYDAQGTTIIGQFRRYVTRQDPSYIGRALYEFLMGVCGFIAEYGLIPPDGGFRSRWAEPASLIEELANAGHLTRRGEARRVYADGMTDVEVLAAIDKLADEHRARCEKGRADRAFNRDVSIAIKLLEPRRFTIVPAGWRLIDQQDQAPHAAPAGSLAEAIHRLANRNGLALICPPAVEPGGQTRLL